MYQVARTISQIETIILGRVVSEKTDGKLIISARGGDTQLSVHLDDQAYNELFEAGHIRKRILTIGQLEIPLRRTVGRPPKGKGLIKKIEVRMEPDLRQVLTDACEQTGLDLSTLVRAAIRHYIREKVNAYEPHPEGDTVLVVTKDPIDADPNCQYGVWAQYNHIQLDFRDTSVLTAGPGRYWVFPIDHPDRPTETLSETIIRKIPIEK